MQIEAVLQEYGWPDVDRPCLVCGNWFPLRRAGVEVRDVNDPTMIFGNVCPDCLERAPEEIQCHLTRQAEELEQRAQWLRALAEAGLPLPTRGHFGVFEEEVENEERAKSPWADGEVRL
jgi:hypothetical protein